MKKLKLIGLFIVNGKPIQLKVKKEKKTRVHYNSKGDDLSVIYKEREIHPKVRPKLAKSRNHQFARRRSIIHTGAVHLGSPVATKVLKSFYLRFEGKYQELIY